MNKIALALISGFFAVSSFAQLSAVTSGAKDAATAAATSAAKDAATNAATGAVTKATDKVKSAVMPAPAAAATEVKPVAETKPAAEDKPAATTEKKPGKKATKKRMKQQAQ